MRKTDAMRETILSLILCAVAMCADAAGWNASWISTDTCPDKPDTWVNLRKTVRLKKKPEKAVARIAADSKYWFWVNGHMAVFEGALKRGPGPEGTYYDEVDIAPWLRKGENRVDVLLWYFGRDGFSHKSSGKAGLIFDCDAGETEILSDTTWRCRVNPSYGACGDPKPNYRLSESSILFDARKGLQNWGREAADAKGWRSAQVVAAAGEGPWGELVKRPVPMWRFGEPVEYTRTFQTGDSLVGVLPYNAQVTPVIRLRAEAGKKIVIGTDNYFHYNGATENIRAEYITADGEQEYESPGWMNGHRVYYVIPDGVEVLGIKYRESGYDCGFAGSFTCSDPLLNALWEKSRRTLYVTMRDTYMDCPERERAQWTGDAVNESGESYYALSPESHALARKWLLELAAWQRPDSVIYAPVPAGNWNTELPGQSLASVGYYGAWNYYMHTGDLATMREVYPAFRKYLLHWHMGKSGLVDMPKECWFWGDWGDNRDMTLLINAWYYLALKGMALTAQELGLEDDCRLYTDRMKEISDAFNSRCWNGSAYRSEGYKGATDDRVQALAVVAGIADKEKYTALMDVFRTEFHASPYMEKYVFEAMMLMGYADEAVARHKNRFRTMVRNGYFTTLFEHWHVGVDGFAGGSVNHAWTGGGLTVLSQYLCGISPAEAGYGKVRIMPSPGSMEHASAEVMSVRGPVKSAFRRVAGGMEYAFSSPAEVPVLVGIPAGKGQKDIKEIAVNGVTVWSRGKYIGNRMSEPVEGPEADGYVWLELPGGEYKVTANEL